MTDVSDLDAIYFNSNTCNVWLSYRHLKKVSTRKGRFATGKQSPAKQTLDKDFDVCICSCFAVVVTFNCFELFTRISFLNTLRYFAIANIQNYSSSFVNPNVYAFRIPEFKQAFRSCCFGRQAVLQWSFVQALNVEESGQTVKTCLIIAHQTREQKKYLRFWSSVWWPSNFIKHY